MQTKTRNRNKKLLAVILTLWCACFSLVLPLKAQITSNLIAYWPFDETNGTTAFDATTNGNNGSLIGYPDDNSQWVAGRIGGALSFAGENVFPNQYVIVPDYPNVITNTMTVSAWVWANSRPMWGTVIKNFGDSLFGQFHLGLWSLNGNEQFLVTQPNYAYVNTEDPSQIPTNSWQFFCGVCDGQSVRLYRNGVLVDSQPFGGVILNPTPIQSLGIGAKLDDTGTHASYVYPGYWDGMIDDIGLWNRALSDNEVFAIYQAGLNGKSLTNADDYLNLLPTVLASPVGATRYTGESMLFKVSTAGASPLNYQWLKDNTPLTDATNSSLTLSMLTTNNQASYSVVVTNIYGSVTSAPAALVISRVAGITTALTAYWPFDETSGLLAADVTTNADDAELINCAGDNTTWVPGKIGGAISLGGPAAQNQVWVASYPKATSTLTISLWAWANSLPVWGTMIKNYGDAIAGQFHLGLSGSAGTLSDYFQPQGGGGVALGESAPFPTNGWQHVALVYDGAMVRLYRNGSLVASTPYNGTIITNAPLDSIGIGYKTGDDGIDPAWASGPGFWDGKLDDIGYWTRGLTAEEILAIYVAGNAGQPLTEAVVTSVTAPIIGTMPQSVTLQEGQAASFNAVASGTPPLSYQWQLNGSDIAGATNTSVTISNGLCLGTADSVWVIVCNAGGCTTSTPPATITVTALPSIPITTGLIGYWPFDETSGTIAHDLSINGDNGVLQDYAGGNSQWVAGEVGGALSFGGLASSNWVLVANYPKPSVQLTASAWVWANSLPPWGTIVKNFGNNLWGELHLGLDGSGNYLCDYLAQQDGGLPSVFDTTVFPTHSWQHVAVVCDGALMLLYRNGILVGTGSYDGQLKTNGPPSLGIGCKTDDTGLVPGIMYGTSYWDGKIDEVALWNRGLSSGEINEIYEFGLAGVGITAVNPIPSLTAVASAGSLTISWFAAPAGECYVLESSVQLRGGSWNSILTVPTLSNGRYSVNVSIGSGNVFYRLRHQ